MKRSGIADLPLHSGRVPAWLSERMTKLGTSIVEAILLNYGRSEFLSRLADPFWFQALGSVMGMDWHSSGITTSVMGALKRGLAPKADELGLYICGGRGKHSRNTPNELRSIAEVVHGAPTRFSDPARFSFSLGGKDRHPFPVPLKTYDESISVLRTSLDAARVGDKEKLDGFRRLEKFTRLIEEHKKPHADFDAAIAHEKSISQSLGGRSVFDKMSEQRGNARGRQLSLFND